MICLSSSSNSQPRGLYPASPVNAGYRKCFNANTGGSAWHSVSQMEGACCYEHQICHSERSTQHFTWSMCSHPAYLQLLFSYSVYTICVYINDPLYPNGVWEFRARSVTCSDRRHKWGCYTWKWNLVIILTMNGCTLIFYSLTLSANIAHRLGLLRAQFT